MVRELGKAPDESDVRSVFVRHFADVFERDVTRD